MIDPKQISRMAESIARLEQLVDHLYAHLGIRPPPVPDAASHASPRVIELIRAGDTLGAIKQLRHETGCDLATAKDRVDTLAAQYG